MYAMFKYKDFVTKYASLINVALFCAITYFFHEFWWAFSSEIKSIPGVIETADWLALQVSKASFMIIHNTYDTKLILEPGNTLRFSNNGYITVNESCSGLKQFYQIAVLFLLFPGPWMKKLWFIPLSFMIMHLTNILRIVFLGMVTLWLPDHWHFVHDWILRPFFYVVIFLLWVWWVERYGGFGRRKGSDGVKRRE